MNGSSRIAPASFWLCAALLAACGGRADPGETGGSGGAGAVGGAGGAGATDGGAGSAGTNPGGAGGTSGDDDGGAGASGGAAGAGATGGVGGSAGSGTTGGSGGAAGNAGAGTTGGSAGSTGGAAGGGGGSIDAGDPLDVSSPPDVGFDGRYPDGCVALTCTPVGGAYCGRIGDGCGGAIDCGGCPGAQVCGARTPKVCGAPCPLCPQIAKCDGASTTVSGTVVTGAMTLADPVYSAQVYIPNLPVGGKLGPITAGPSCNRCTLQNQDDIIASTITGPDGKFTLSGVPAGTGIPLVVQLGHWRYETTIDVTACTDNVLPDGKARLPRTQSEGNIPLTAVSTGNVDSLECLFRKMGVQDSEFSNPTGAGRIHFYRSNGARYDATTPAQADLVGTGAGTGQWNRYDQILFPCEGAQTNEVAGALTSFVDYASQGGRIITTHYSYTWLYQNGGFATAGTWQVAQANPTNPLIANVDTTTQKGRDFATWLQLVGALSNPNPTPQVSISDPRHDLNAVPMGNGGQRWLWSDSPMSVQHMSIDTPVNATPDKTCGRVIYSDFHVANSTNQNLTFPAECLAGDLTPQEKMLEFMLLDLSTCVGIPPHGPPPPPPPPDPPF